MKKCKECDHFKICDPEKFKIQGQCLGLCEDNNFKLVYSEEECVLEANNENSIR